MKSIAQKHTQENIRINTLVRKSEILKRISKQEKLRRSVRQTLLFNNREKRVIENFCDKYKITNRSKFMRETIITAILKQLDDDYPTLFDDGSMNLFNSSYKYSR